MKKSKQNKIIHRKHTIEPLIIQNHATLRTFKANQKNEKGVKETNYYPFMSLFSRCSLVRFGTLK